MATAYESVRTDLDRFLAVRGHETEAVARIVERHPEYPVVVRCEGEPRRPAPASDPRAS